MQLLISSEQRFERTPDGAVWTPNANSYTFWSRYLEAFDDVRVLARIRDVVTVDRHWVRADGPQVAIHGVPHFIGPIQYVAHYFSIQRAIRRSFRHGQAVIMRVPSSLSHALSATLSKRGYPYALEVVGDPNDVFAPGAVEHPLRAFFRYRFSSKLQAQCADACGVAYVTRHTLQKRYPSRAIMVGVSDVALPDQAFSTSYSSIELRRTEIAASSRVAASRRGQATLGFVGSLAQLYKAPDILLRAVAKCVQNGCDLRLKMIGDGRYHEMLRALAAELGIANRCEFLGELPGGGAVRDILDSCDLFVLPSRVEGLPRAVIEAMARGLPCIGSWAGGIPELLPEEDLVQPGNVDALASLIEKVVADPERQLQMSARNLEHSREYADDILRARRVEFYRHVKDATEHHLSNQPPPTHNGPYCSRRVMDFLLAVIIFLAASPLILSLSFAIRATLGSPVIFRQFRPGLNGRLFTMYKFRTMRDAYDEDGNPLPDDERLTRFGRFLRSSSLDELPELWNVLKGDMSLVGPRPLLPEYLSRYTELQRRRHEVKPGITGWAQINGRNGLSWEEKFNLDVWYVNNQSLVLDLRILWRTLLTVVRRDGITENGHVSMSKFMGSV
jgi:lipopolysaccharide/colanic/teichoic acid biosynthesis glycosyltransferase/glycosyltransferase involved in cell wall biosynthesis